MALRIDQRDLQFLAAVRIVILEPDGFAERRLPEVEKANELILSVLAAHIHGKA
jgi:hypothetical protein